MVKTWLITGSSRGLGRALAEAVLNAGDNLVATARNTSGLEDLADRYPGIISMSPSFQLKAASLRLSRSTWIIFFLSVVMIELQITGPRWPLRPPSSRRARPASPRRPESRHR